MFTAIYSILFHFFPTIFKNLRISINLSVSWNISYSFTISKGTAGMDLRKRIILTVKEIGGLRSRKKRAIAGPTY
jgi:hypothetical protein